MALLALGNNVGLSDFKHHKRFYSNGERLKKS